MIRRSTGVLSPLMSETFCISRCVLQMSNFNEQFFFFYYIGTGCDIMLNANIKKTSTSIWYLNTEVYEPWTITSMKPRRVHQVLPASFTHATANRINAQRRPAFLHTYQTQYNLHWFRPFDNPRSLVVPRLQSVGFHPSSPIIIIVISFNLR